jgi:hypothetical protein
MSYLSLKGKFANLLVTPEGKNKEGEIYGGKHQLQLLCHEVLRNGETRLNLVNLYVADAGSYSAKTEGDLIEVPVGIFVPPGVKYSFFAAKR